MLAVVISRACGHFTELCAFLGFVSYRTEKDTKSNLILTRAGVAQRKRDHLIDTKIKIPPCGNDPAPFGKVFRRLGDNAGITNDL